MNWLKRKIRRWLDSAEDITIDSPMAINKASTQSVNTEPALHFKIYPAIGGKVVEFSRYDRKTDRSDHQIYIIGKDEDFGEKIAKISTIEVLR